MMAGFVIVILLMGGAYLLGACPFSLWIGAKALHRDIRQFGDGNPGASNVFRAGGKGWEVAAIVADIVKGIPVILLAELCLGFTGPVLFLIAFCAVLGHAFSPFLNFRGGKALAVFGGTLFALQQWDIVICMALLFSIGFLLIGSDSWIVIIGSIGAMMMLAIAESDQWALAFMAAVTFLFVIKNYHELRILPNM